MTTTLGSNEPNKSARLGVFDGGPLAVVQDLPWYKSTTFWGIAIPIVLNLLSAVFKKDISLSGEDTTNLIQAIVSIVSLAGGIIALRGRSKAVSGGVARSLYFTSPKR